MRNPIRIAILVDGEFFIKRHRCLNNFKHITPNQLAKDLYNLCLKHIGKDNYLYRILYYDCSPFEKRIHNPISGKVINFGKTDQAVFKTQFFEELKRFRKVALRLGFVKGHDNWIIKRNKTKELLQGKIKVSDLKENDVFYEMHQKGIDIKIGTDITSIALKKQVDQIILISGDCDFVPAAKLARREGIDFILDPMWNNIDPSLFEHIDGLKSTCQRPKRITPSGTTP